MQTLMPSVATWISVGLTLAALVAGGAAIPTGEPVAIASRSAYPPSVICVEQRLVIVRVEPGHNLFINSEPVSAAMLPHRLNEIFRTRIERVAFVLGGSATTFGDVAQVIAEVRKVAQNVGLLTPSSVPTSAEPLLVGAFPVKTVWHKGGTRRCD